MDIGIESYSYHRLFGETRLGEEPIDAGARWPCEPGPVLAHARQLQVDTVFLQTCFLPPPDTVQRYLRGATDGFQLGLSWGHPWPADGMHGLDGGRSETAENDLRRWIDAAAGLSLQLMRITAGSPVSRGPDPSALLVHRLVAPLRRAARYAAQSGIRLALENHADLSAVEIVALLSLVDCANLGVCLDPVNLTRIGDDMLVGTELLAGHTLMVHVKDCPAGDPAVPGGPVSVALGEGAVDVPGVLRILAAHDFDGPLLVELGSLGPGAVDELALIERSVTWLRQRSTPG